MNATFPLRRIAAFAVLGLGLLLSACLLTPGKFDSKLDVRKDGRFTFSYTGEISMLGLSKLAELGRKGDEKFEPAKCYKDDGETERDCTAAELDAQKADWEKEQKDAAEKAKRDAENSKALFGGIDPSSPKAAEEMADRLRRQAGWKSVVYKGDGLYQVDFAITGRLDHDFVFPTIEKFPVANAFVTIIRRADGSVRIDTPAFGPSSGTSNTMSGLAGLAALGDKKDGEKPPVPEMDGHFTITTDGTILANNTDEGPQKDPAGQRLTWAVNARSGSAPTALIKLGS